jgi:hypothetical protein
MGFNNSDYQFILHNSATTFRSTVEKLLIFETGLLPTEICRTYVLAILYIDYGYHEVDVSYKRIARLVTNTFYSIKQTPYSQIKQQCPTGKDLNNYFAS